MALTHAPPSAISLGSHCYAAWLLDRMGLRRAAYPFDWLFSDPGMVADCVADDFAALLDPAALVVARPGHHGHAAYSERYGRPVIFQHHDPTRPAGRDYLLRCVGRLRAVLDGDAAKLFLVVGRRERTAATTLDRLQGALADRTRNGFLLAVSVAAADSVASGPYLSVRDCEPGRRCYDLVPTSEMRNGLSFRNAADNTAISELVSRHLSAPRPPA